MPTALGNHGADQEHRLDVTNVELPKQVATYTKEQSSKPAVLFLPEGVVYDWSPVTDLFWSIAMQGTNTTVIVGGYEFDEVQGAFNSRPYVFGIGDQTEKRRVDLSSVQASTFFPWLMWNPTAGLNHFPAHWPQGSFEIDDHSVHFSWCYEDVVVWPHLMAAIQGADVMVSLRNMWSYKGTSFVTAQRVGAKLNARWLGAATLAAENR